MSRALAAVALAVYVAVPAVPASAQPPKGAPGVRVDFRAFAEDGSPIADLKAEELSLKVNGKPRAIKSLNLFKTIGGDAAAPGSGLPAPYATNIVGASGRVLHVLIDDDSIAPGRENALREAMRLLTSELAPADRIGVLSAQGQLNLAPGTDPTKVRLAVDGLAGRASATESDADAQCRTVRVLGTLATMLSMTRGAPTTIVMFAGGLAPPAQTITEMRRRPSASADSLAAGGNDACPVRPEDFEKIGALAGSSHADLYLFHVIDGMATHSSAQDAGFESLAGVTGAEFVRLVGSPQTAVSRLLRETAAYYVATFEPEAGERNGQVARIELRSTRDKVKLRSRPSLEIPKDTAKAAASPKDMLRVADAYHDLPLRATAYTSRNPGSDEVKIVALFEGAESSVALASASVGLFDEKNTLKKQWSAQAADLAKRPVMAALTAPPGTYRLRVAALDTSGRTGTTDHELKAEVPRADPLKLSTLVLGTQQQGGAFAPRLEFTSEPVAIGLLEIYGVPKGSAVTVNLDVVTSAEGAAIATAQATISPGPSEDMRIAFGGFNIASLAPGDYLMRAVVSLDGKPVGRVERTLRKAQ